MRRIRWVRPEEAAAAVLDDVTLDISPRQAARWPGAGFDSEPLCSAGIWPVKFCQHAFAEGGRSVCLELDSDVTGCHGRPRSSGPAGDGADCGSYLVG